MRRWPGDSGDTQHGLRRSLLNVAGGQVLFVENVCCEVASPTGGTEEGNRESPVLPDQYVSCSGVSLQRWEAE